MARYEIPEGTPSIKAWVVKNDGHVIYTDAYRVEDAYPDAEPGYKWAWAGFDSDIRPQYDTSRPNYIVPEAGFQTSRAFLYDTPAAAALAALDRVRKDQERLDARLDSILAALA